MTAFPDLDTVTIGTADEVLIGLEVLIMDGAVVVVTIEVGVEGVTEVVDTGSIVVVVIDDELLTLVTGSVLLVIPLVVVVGPLVEGGFVLVTGSLVVGT